MKPELQRFETQNGARVYRIPLQVFPEMWGYAHLVIAGDVRALVDVGSGFDQSNQQLETGLQRVRSEHGEAADWGELTHILISHGHIDHFGGLTFVRQRSPAPLGIHELDRRVLTGWEARVATMAGRLRAYFEQAGTAQQETGELLDFYLLGKQLFSATAVDFTFEAIGMRLGELEFIHVPGHSPGQVVIRCAEILLSADHVLPVISPHLAPEQLSMNTGMEHYLQSLRRTERLAGEVQLVLGGHEQPFTDLAGRIEEIRELYRRRLDKVLELLERPRTIVDLAQPMFGETAGYHRLLALEEAGAYVEYLQQRGYLAFEELEPPEPGAAPVRRYRRSNQQEFTMPRLLDHSIGTDQLSGSAATGG